MIAAAGATNLYNIFPDEYIITRDTYLGFTIIGLIISILIIVLYSLNIINVGFARKIPWSLIVSIYMQSSNLLFFYKKFLFFFQILTLDVLWLIPMFILSIVCAIKEGNVKDQTFSRGTYVNKGGFAAAAFFGFSVSLLYGIDAGIHLVDTVRRLSDK